MLFSLVIGGLGALFRVRSIPKGHRAPYTMRAPTSLAWNQHEIHAEDLRGFTPFYDETPEVLAARHRATLAELDRLPASFWRARADETAGEADGGAAEAAAAVERRAEVGALAERLFEVFLPYYEDGVVADDDFPARQREIRIFSSETPPEAAPAPEAEGPAETPSSAPAEGSPAPKVVGAGPAPFGGRYRRRAVAHLHRFSELRPAAEAALGRGFAGVDRDVRLQVIGYVLDRLPPNLRYSRTNADHVADRSLVTGEKAVLVRDGEVLVRRRQIIDTRAEDALRAALEAQRSRLAVLLARLGLILIVALLGSQAMAASGTTLARPVPQATVLGALALLIGGGKVALALWPLSETVVPLAAVPAAVAFVAGARPAAVVALVGACFAALGLAFDLTTFTVVLGGGLALALVVRRGRWRRAVLAAGVAALTQAALVGACVLLGGRPASIDSIFVAAQALAAGLAAGVAGVLLGALGRLVERRGSGVRRQRSEEPGAALESPEARARMTAP